MRERQFSRGFLPTSGQDQPSVPIDSVLYERVVEIDVAKSSSIIPMVVSPARPNSNSILQVVFGDQKRALHRQVIGPEAGLARVRVSARVSAIDRFCHIIASPRDAECFIATVPIAGAMLEQCAHSKIRALYSIG
jgi:hypothetical protein